MKLYQFRFMFQNVFRPNRSFFFLSNHSFVSEKSLEAAGETHNKEVSRRRQETKYLVLLFSKRQRAVFKGFSPASFGEIKLPPFVIWWISSSVRQRQVAFSRLHQKQSIHLHWLAADLLVAGRVAPKPCVIPLHGCCPSQPPFLPPFLHASLLPYISRCWSRALISPPPARPLIKFRGTVKDVRLFFFFFVLQFDSNGCRIRKAFKSGNKEEEEEEEEEGQEEWGAQGYLTQMINAAAVCLSATPHTNQTDYLDDFGD